MLLVDEAGMAETRVLAHVLELVAEAEGRAILVGDPHQLPPVGAGLFPALCERLGAISLADNRRQRDLSERRALALLGEGDPHPYLAHAAKRGRLHLERDPTNASHRLLDDWWQSAQHDLAGSVMLAYRRSDVRELNEAARMLLAGAGRLGPDATEVGARDFRIGDRVLCRRNDLSLGVRNGTRGTIVDLAPSTLTLRTDRGSLRSLPLGYAEADLDHAYALTGHAAQGATLERLRPLPRPGSAARVGLRRLLTGPLGDAPLHDRARPARARDPAPRSNPAAPPERAARALERSSAEPLALDQSQERRTMTMGLITQEQEWLDRQRERTTTRLAAARRELQDLHWWSRASRAQLEAEIALHRSALERADRKREQLRELAEKRSHTPVLAREGDELAPPVRPEPSRPRLEREPPGLGLEL